MCSHYRPHCCTGNARATENLSSVFQDLPLLVDAEGGAWKLKGDLRVDETLLVLPVIWTWNSQCDTERIRWCYVMFVWWCTLSPVICVPLNQSPFPRQQSEGLRLDFPQAPFLASMVGIVQDAAIMLLSLLRCFCIADKSEGGGQKGGQLHRTFSTDITKLRNLCSDPKKCKINRKYDSCLLLCWYNT